MRFKRYEISGVIFRVPAIGVAYFQRPKDSKRQRSLLLTLKQMLTETAADCMEVVNAKEEDE